MKSSCMLNSYHYGEGRWGRKRENSFKKINYLTLIFLKNDSDLPVVNTEWSSINCNVVFHFFNRMMFFVSCKSLLYTYVPVCRNQSQFPWLQAYDNQWEVNIGYAFFFLAEMVRCQIFYSSLTWIAKYTAFSCADKGFSS